MDIWVALPPIFLLITFVSVLGNEGGGFLGLGRGPDVGLDPRDGDWIWYVLPEYGRNSCPQDVILAIYGARVIRGAVLNTKENAYIDAARAIGAGHIRIMFHYILPNIMPVVIVLAGSIGVAVLAEATISFLGFGIAQPFPTWGQVLGTDGRTYGPTAEHLMWIPGLAIFSRYTRLTCWRRPSRYAGPPASWWAVERAKPEPRVPFSLTRRSVADYVPGSLGPALWMIVLFTILPVLACGGDDTSSDNPTAR